MRNEDCRSKEVVFLSSCLLNTHNKTKGGARFPGFWKDFMDVLGEYGVGIQQIDCPEVMYMGVQRWDMTKNLYDNVGFRRHCRKLAEHNADYMESYKQVGYRTVAFLVCNGSPTCGYDLTAYDDNWGGDTNAAFAYEDALVPGMGVFVEEMHKAIEARGFELPPFFGVGLDVMATPLDDILRDFKIFMESATGRTSQ